MPSANRASVMDGSCVPTWSYSVANCGTTKVMRKINSPSTNRINSTG